MKKLIYKITSLTIVISMLLTCLTVFAGAFAEEEQGEGELQIVYNRGYEDGWDWDNGFDKSMKNSIDANLTYLKYSAAWYNYFIKFAPSGDRGGYVGIPFGEDNASDSGKTFLEFELYATEDNNIGNIVLVRALDNTLYHIVSIENGELFLLGQSVGAAPTYFKDVEITFDFEYANNNVEAKNNEYRVTAAIDGKKVEKIYTSDGTFGISDIYFGAEENLTNRNREGDCYYVDNLKVYYGVEEKTELDVYTYGSAVNSNAARTYKVMGIGSVGGYLSGSPNLERRTVAEDDKIFYNRYFSEGWDFDVGTTGTANLRDNDFSITTDYSSEMAKGDAGFLNYYFQFVQRNDQNAIMSLEVLSIAPRNVGKAFFEFDIKCSTGANIPSVLTFLTTGSVINYISVMSIKNGDLYVLDQNVGQLGEEWCHVVFEMDYEWGPANGDETALKLTAYVGSAGTTVSVIKNIDNPDTCFRTIRQIRIGKGNTSGARDGDWFGLDNLQFYHATDPLVIPDDNPGVLINPNTVKPIQIQNGNESMSIGNAVETSLSMKVNSNNALLRGEKVALFEDAAGNAYGAPYKVDGKVMVPIDAIINYTSVPYRYNSDGLGCDIYVNGNYRSISVGRDTVLVNGEIYQLHREPEVKVFGDNTLFYICLDDVEKLFDGFFVTYDEVGFISIALIDDYLNRDDDEAFMRDIMKRFIFESLEKEDVYPLLKENSDNFTHPYFYVTQDRFDYLYDVYHSAPGDEVYDEDLYYYLDYSLEYALDYYNKYAAVDEKGNYIGLKEGQWVPSSEGIVSWVTTRETGNHSVSIMPYPETGGYDPAGGRLNVISDGETGLSMACQILAHAFQFTHNYDYVRFVYDWSVALCQWEHWAPGHYLNCAQPCLNIALAYDWLYNAYIELGLDPAPIRDGLYKHGTVTAWRSLNYLPCEFVRKQGDASRYWSHVGNWNSVSAAGVMAACMVAMEDSAYVDMASEAYAKTVYYLQVNGFNLFGFDGSYRETAGYWCATIRFIQYDIMLVQAVTGGDDLGLLDAPGLDITNYFGSHMESSEYKRWNYGDDWEGSQDNYWYYLSAILFDNPEYAAMRYINLKNGKEPYRWDTLWYDPEIAKNAAELGLDFVLDSLETVLSRSSWEPGALYVGLQGDKNHVAHGQYDSGNWIYDNAGVRWFVDLGADNYNLAGGGFAMGYYRYSTEGQNTIALASQPVAMPHGQMYESGGKLVKSLINQHGSVGVLDQAPAFGGEEYMSYARRGMLLTNDRKTVVIQDEIACVVAQDLYWFAHYDTRRVTKVTLSSDGKTAYMEAFSPIEKQTVTLRVSLITANRGFKFEIWDTETFALENTPRPDYSPSVNGLYEQNRSYFNKLVIKAEGTLKFEVAVVLELIDPNNPIEVGYKQGWAGNPVALQPMTTWVPSEDIRSLEDKPEDTFLRREANMSSILIQSENLAQYIIGGSYFGTMREEFFKALADVEYSLLRYGRDFPSAELKAAVEKYNGARQIYDKYADKSKRDVMEVRQIVTGLVGLNTTNDT